MPEKPPICPTVCLEHSGHVAKIETLADSMTVIKRMFFAIVIGMILTVVGLYGNLYSQHNGEKAIAQEYEETVNQ